jgi:acyl-CoA synthetase (NDP forming)
MNKLADNFKLLEKEGLKIAPYKVVYRSKASFDIGEEIGYPVVLKAGVDIHKMEIGGVMTHIHNGLDMCEAWRKIKYNLDSNGIKEEELIVQKQINGTELIIGLKEDKIFGPIIMLGSGGSFAEVIKDVTFRACPITSLDAEEMIKEIKSYELLRGVRGEKPAKIDALKDMLFVLSRLHRKFTFSEMDLNPVIVNEEGAFIVDVRIV